MRLSLVLALSLLLASSVALTALADGGDGAQPRDQESEHAGNASENGSQGHHGRGATAFGAFAATSGSDHALAGRFVSFSYSASGIEGFAVNGTHIFDLAVSPSGATGDRVEADPEGAQVRIQADAFEAQVHDDPQAVTRVEARGATITVTLAPGSSASVVADHSATFRVGSVAGRVRGDGLAVHGSTITARERILVFVESPRGAFDVKRGDIGEAIAEGHVGAEGSFNRNGTGVVEDLISYGNVTMRTIRAEHGNVTVQVEGHGTEGRVLVLNVDRAILGAQAADKLRITLDNRTVDVENDLHALLDPNADGSRPVYHVIFDPTSDAFQVLVRVPHYSVHTLSVFTLAQNVTPSVVIGVVAGVALLAPSAMLLFRRKKDA